MAEEEEKKPERVRASDEYLQEYEFALQLLFASRYCLSDYHMDPIIRVMNRFSRELNHIVQGEFNGNEKAMAFSLKLWCGPYVEKMIEERPDYKPHFYRPRDPNWWKD
jgi:hypothetical protein